MWLQAMSPSIETGLVCREQDILTLLNTLLCFWDKKAKVEKGVLDAFEWFLEVGRGGAHRASMQIVFSRSGDHGVGAEAQFFFADFFGFWTGRQVFGNFWETKCSRKMPCGRSWRSRGCSHGANGASRVDWGDIGVQHSDCHKSDLHSQQHHKHKIIIVKS